MEILKKLRDSLAGTIAFSETPAFLLIFSACLFKVGKSAVKSIGKSLSKEFSEEAVDGFTRQALRQKTGMAAARIFKQAGKSSSFVY